MFYFKKRSCFALGTAGILGILWLTSCSTVKEEPTAVPEPPAMSKPVTGKESPIKVLKSVSLQKEGPKTAEDLVVLAERHYNGFHTKRNVKKALELFVEAANKGSGYACRRLGLEYSDFAFDDLTPRDDPKARAWFEKGAELGDAESMFYLSQFVYEGRGGPKNEKRATELLLSAARHKSQAAAHRVVKLASRGTVTISDEEKRQFYRLDKQLRDGVTMRG